MLMYYLSLLDAPADKQKFEMLYRRYRSLMKYIALRYLNSGDLAEDAVHDAFLKLIQYLDCVKEVGSPQTEAFLIQLTKTVSLDRCRKENRIPVVNLEEIGELADERVHLEEHLEAEDLLERLDPLPETYRDVLELKIYHDLTDRQIAELLGISPANVRKRLERARKCAIRLAGKDEG